ncbi:hypothetical protein [Hydrocarboniphaga effusa]|uniref:hypothetical protein n=1 Tax=Hydrocarboniphaga effusa TaxID=243629 RepID=UPI00398BE84E
MLPDVTACDLGPDGACTARDRFCLDSCTVEVGGVGLSLSTPPPEFDLATYVNPLTYTVSSLTCQVSEHREWPSDPQQLCEEWAQGTVCIAKSDPRCLTLNGALWFCDREWGVEAGFMGEPIGELHSTTNTPPAPDAGTAGQPATPTVSVCRDGSCQYWYDQETSDGSTTNGGSGNPGDGGGNGGGNNGGNGDGDGNGGGGTLNGGESCELPPTCAGDDVGCYQARQLWQLQCKFQPPAPDQLQAEMDRFSDPTPEDGTILEVIKQDVSQLLIPYQPGACISDLEIPFSLGSSSKTITIPLSEYCEIFVLLGMFLHLGAAWMSVKILVG